MTIFHLFQKLDRTMRNRPDTNRWRVTMNESQVEIFRRPVLTSEVTLGALGIGNAPMPVPVCVCTAVSINESTTTVDVYDSNGTLIISTSTHSAVHYMMRHVEDFLDVHGQD
jgi:hypothetical protein